MNCWHILQILPTDDERAIRRAYAKLLKHTRPDEDAAAYQALREAFDQAIALAPYIRREHGVSEPAERQPENHKHHFQAAFAHDAAAASESETPSESDPGQPENRKHRFQAAFAQDTADSVAGNPQQAGCPETSASPYAEPSAPDNATLLTARIARVYDAGGSAALAAEWPHIREALDRLPLGSANRLSPQFAGFLRRCRITYPPVWVQWADYFGWGEDVHGSVLSPEEAQRLSQYRRFAQRTAANRSHLTVPPEIAGHAETDGDPLFTRAFAAFLGGAPNHRQRFQAACAAVLLWPQFQCENNRDDWNALAEHRPAMFQLLLSGRRLRNLFSFVLSVACLCAVFLFAGQGSKGALETVFAAGLLALENLAMLVLAGLLLVLAEAVPPLDRWLETRWPQIKYRPPAVYLYVFALPPLAAAAAEYLGSRHPDQMFLALLPAAASWMYYLPYLGDRRFADWLIAGASVSGVLAWVVFGGGDMQQKLVVSAVMMVWFNYALYLMFDGDGLFEQAQAYLSLRGLFRLSGSLPKLPALLLAILVAMLKLLFAAFLCLLLLPALTARAAMRGQYGLIAETAAFALLLSLPVRSADPSALYAAVLLAMLLHRLLEHLGLRLLQQKNRVA